MAGWDRHSGLAVALPMENIDTDQLVPARFMSTPRSEGYGRFLLHDLRHDESGTPHADFPLNAAPEASILVARRNFGGGSSREAAVYTLVDAGFRIVIAPSFGDIFAGNAINNGLLPAKVSEAEAEHLIAALAEPAEAHVDLTACRIRLDAHDIGFELDPIRQRKLINGWDDIDLTRADADRIAAFRDRRREAAPWAWPTAPQR